MTICQNLTEFAGRPVRDYDPKEGLKEAGSSSPRLRLDYEEFSQGQRLGDLLSKFLAEPSVFLVKSLVIGVWDFESAGDSSVAVNALAGASERLSGLEALFLGDITSEEQEISWIVQSDITPLLTKLPHLKMLRIRGAQGLSLGPVHHGKLEHFAVESGGLPSTMIESIVAADFPNLRHLELWLGASDYGYDQGLPLLKPILDGARFPKLEVLGLRDSEEQDAVAAAVSSAKIMDRIRVLDLSLGNLSDAGAQALLDSGKLSRLDHLDIHHHYLSDSVVAELSEAVKSLDASDQQEDQSAGDDDIERYIAVSE